MSTPSLMFRAFTLVWWQPVTLRYKFMLSLNTVWVGQCERRLLGKYGEVTCLLLKYRATTPVHFIHVWNCLHLYLQTNIVKPHFFFITCTGNKTFSAKIRKTLKGCPRRLGSFALFPAIVLSSVYTKPGTRPQSSWNFIRKVF